MVDDHKPFVLFVGLCNIFQKLKFDQPKTVFGSIGLRIKVIDVGSLQSKIHRSTLLMNGSHLHIYYHFLTQQHGNLFAFLIPILQLKQEQNLRNHIANIFDISYGMIWFCHKTIWQDRGLLNFFVKTIFFSIGHLFYWKLR